MVSFSIDVFVEVRIIAFFSGRAESLGNHGYQLILFAKVDDSLAIIALVTHDPFKPSTPLHCPDIGEEQAEQNIKSGGIMDIPGRQDKQERIPVAIANHVDLGGESSSRTPKGLLCRAVFRIDLWVARFFCRAPAACRWALI